MKLYGFVGPGTVLSLMLVFPALGIILILAVVLAIIFSKPKEKKAVYVPPEPEEIEPPKTYWLFAYYESLYEDSEAWLYVETPVSVKFDTTDPNWKRKAIDYIAKRTSYNPDLLSGVKIVDQPSTPGMRHHVYRWKK